MHPEIKLSISYSDKVIHAVNKELHTKGLVKSIEDFQVVANAAMTKLIEDSEDSGQISIMEDGDDSDNEDEDEIVAPKKKK